MALQAAQRFPDLPFVLGAAIEVDGNHVHAFRDFRVFSFPVKQHWIEPADPDLIQQSARQLWYAFWKMHLDKVYLVRPGCGNGQLKWEDVKPLIAPILDNNGTRLFIADALNFRDGLYDVVSGDKVWMSDAQRRDYHDEVRKHVEQINGYYHFTPR